MDTVLRRYIATDCEGRTLPMGATTPETLSIDLTTSTTSDTTPTTSDGSPLMMLPDHVGPFPSVSLPSLFPTAVSTSFLLYPSTQEGVERIPAMQQKLSWKQLHETVRRMNAVQQTVQKTFISNTVFSRHNRLYFLGISPQDREPTLYFLDVNNREAGDTDGPIEWTHAFQDTNHACLASPGCGQDAGGAENPAAIPLRISSFTLNPRTDQLLFFSSGNLYICQLNKELGTGIPCVIPSRAKGTRIDAKVCLNDPNLISFIRAGDIYVATIDVYKELRLTWTHTASNPNDVISNPQSAGIADHVIQEEFNRYTGYWWEPIVPQRSQERSVHRILYVEIDEKNVQLFNLVTADGRVDKIRYPFTGTSNVKSDLRLVEFQMDQSPGECRVVRKVMRRPLKLIFPWFEYLVRAGWCPEGNRVWVQLLDRAQSRLVLVAIPLDYFVDEDTCEEREQQEPFECGPIQILIDETNPIWINVTNIIHFFPRQGNSQMVLWASERTDFKHIYLVPTTFESFNLPNSLYHSVGLAAGTHVIPPVPDDHWLTVTWGEWVVEDSNIWVDESKQLIYFLGNKDTPLEIHLYAISYTKLVGETKSPGPIRACNLMEPVRLTQPGFFHSSITMNYAMSMFVSSYSSLYSLPVTSTYSLLHKATNAPTPIHHMDILRRSSPRPTYPEPDVWSYINSDGDMMYGLVIKPPDFDCKKMYPTLLFVYGGPSVQ
eukprot:Ihof_evm1s546 gene=Ihof_evmTU1s546